MMYGKHAPTPTTNMEYTRFSNFVSVHLYLYHHILGAGLLLAKKKIRQHESLCHEKRDTAY